MYSSSLRPQGHLALLGGGEILDDAVFIQAALLGHQHSVTPLHRLHRQGEHAAHLLHDNLGGDVHAGVERLGGALHLHGDGIAGVAAGGGAVDVDLIHHAGEALVVQCARRWSPPSGPSWILLMSFSSTSMSKVSSERS